MTMKIAVSLPDELVEDARAAVRAGRAASVSAYIASAMAERSQRETLREALDGITQEIGEPTDEDRVWARSALGLDPQA